MSCRHQWGRAIVSYDTPVLQNDRELIDASRGILTTRHSFVVVSFMVKINLKFIGFNATVILQFEAAPISINALWYHKHRTILIVLGGFSKWKKDIILTTGKVKLLRRDYVIHHRPNGAMGLAWECLCGRKEFTWRVVTSHAWIYNQWRLMLQLWCRAPVVFGWWWLASRSFWPRSPWASCQICKIGGCACARNAGNVFPATAGQRDPDMHHGTCVTHGPWCMPGSLTSGFLWSRWRGKRSWHPRRQRNPQFYVSRKRLMQTGPNTTPFFHPFVCAANLCKDDDSYVAQQNARTRCVCKSLYREDLCEKVNVIVCLWKSNKT